MKLIIAPHRPLRKAGMRFAGVCLVAAIFILALDFSHWKSVLAGMLATGDTEALVQDLRALRAENKKLKYDLLRLARLEEIGKAAKEDNHYELVQLRARVAELDREVQFYRDAVGAVTAGAGVRVKGVQFHALASDGRYHYKIVMTHVDKDNRLAEGKLGLVMTGKLRGKRDSLALSALAGAESDTIYFKFKNFQLLEGTIKVPAGFSPEQVSLTVMNRAGTKKHHSETYDWAAVVN